MTTEASRRVAILVCAGANLLDIAGPVQVFTTAGEQLHRAGICGSLAYEIVTLSGPDGAVTTSSGVAVLTQGLTGWRPADFDTILAVGGAGAESPAQEGRLLAWLRSGSPARRIGSICTGAFLLAEAGLLNGRRAVTHWANCDALQARYPSLAVERDAIFIEDGGVWTSAGISAGIDLALALVEQDWGREVALRTARWLVMFVKRQGGQSQFSAPLIGQCSVPGPVSRLTAWIVENPAADLRVPMLAAKAGMTERTLHRAFVEATGRTPAEFVEEVRLEHARRRLEDSEEDVARVAEYAGFVSAERMRRAFLRKLGVGPSNYRERFRIAPLATSDPATLVKLSPA